MSDLNSNADLTEADNSSDAGRYRMTRSLMVNVVIPLGLVAAAVLIVLALGTVEPEQRPAIDTTRVGRLRALPPVRVAQLQELQSTGQRLELEVDGNVVPYREARVAAEVAGRVVFKSDQCEAGSYVKAGQSLMRIDDTDYRLEVQRLERQLDQEDQSIKELDQEIRNTQRLIDVAEKDVELQQKEVDRLRSLPGGFASRAEIDQANRALLAATQQLVTVENQYDLLHQRRVRLEASQKLASTQLAAAKVNLQRTEIAAPIDGVIVSEDADMNTFVARGTTLVTIEDTSKVEVATNLRMDQLYWILDQQGRKIDDSARGYDLPDTPAIIEYEMTGRSDLVYRWAGRLLSYDGIGLDPVTRTVPVRVVVDSPTQYVERSGNPIQVANAPALVRGMYVRVNLLIRPQAPLVVIPAQALQPGNRVLQFVPDESVLDVAAVDASPEEPSIDDQPGTTTTDDRGSFDPDRWVAGRVLVRRSVRPVDSLNIDDGRPSQEFPTGLVPAGRMWVCEVQDADLAGGAYVVVSPLGSIEEGAALAVRADRESMDTVEVAKESQPTDAPVDTSAGQTAVATDFNNGEDA